LYGLSTFCIQPPGDTPSRKAVVDALLAGCIPVVVGRGDSESVYRYPWEDVLGFDYRAILLQVSQRDWYSDLVGFLRGVDPEPYRRAILAVGASIQWHLPHGPAAARAAALGSGAAPLGCVDATPHDEAAHGLHCDGTLEARAHFGDGLLLRDEPDTFGVQAGGAVALPGSLRHALDGFVATLAGFRAVLERGTDVAGVLTARALEVAAGGTAVW
jgi:hypothetical protein